MVMTLAARGTLLTDDQRASMRQEYYQLATFVQAYDGHFLLIKSWGITASSLAIGVGLGTNALGWDGRIGVFLTALALSLAFWVTEVRFKLIQLAHVHRQLFLEKSLQQDVLVATPAILRSYGEGARYDRARRQWKSIALWPQVMLPHVLFAGLSVCLACYSLVQHIVS